MYRRQANTLLEKAGDRISGIRHAESDEISMRSEWKQSTPRSIGSFVCRADCRRSIERRSVDPQTSPPRRAPTPTPPLQGEGERATMPDLLLELFSEEIPARMQARAAEDLKQGRHRPPGRGGARLRRRQGLRDAAAARFGGAGRAGAPARPARGEERPARRRAGERDRGLSQRRRAEIDRRSQGAAGQEGRLLCRADRETGPRRHRCHRRDSARGDQELPVAEVDALGRRLERARRAHLGAAAALHRRHVRARDRRSGHRARFVSAASLPATRRAAIASWRRSRSRCAGSTTISRSSTRPRSCSTPNGARASSSPRPSSSPSRKASNWSRIRACSTKSRAWSNGRWC